MCMKEKKKKKWKILSLFSGVGAFEKALTNIGEEIEVVGFSEIDKYAIKSYCKIHNVAEEKNKGDVRGIESESIESYDILVGGSPCQNISIMSKVNERDKKEKGLKGESSSLFYEYVRVLNETKPEYFIFENVRNLLSSNKGEDFEIVKKKLGENYNIKYKVLNSKDYGIPQVRRRLYIVGKRKDKGEFNYEFPEGVELKIKVKDILEERVEDKYYLSEKMYKTVMSTGTKGWYAKPTTDTEIAKPLTSTMAKMHRASADNYYHTEYKPEGRTNLRRLTPLECFRLQGFTDEDYAKVRGVVSDTQLYRQMGNSITVSVLEGIFKELLRK